MDKEIVIDGKKLQLTNLDKVFWPDEKITKGDLINYYLEIADFLLPYLKDRPQSLNRFPNGILGESFYQKNVVTHPEWVRTEKIWSDVNNDYINYVICNDKATLIYLINLGCIDLNIWSSRIGSLDQPDYLVFDLDPEGITFDKVIDVAKEIHTLFEKLDIPAFPKTSGATGFHIYVPLKSRDNYDHVRELARIVALLINQKLPSITSIERMPQKRQGKVYIDFLQNRKGATMASVYSVRPKTGATVSMPLVWDEVNNRLNPRDFNIYNAVEEIKKRKNLFSQSLENGIDVKETLKRLVKL